MAKKMDEIKLYTRNIKKNSNGNVLKYLSIDKNFLKFQKSISLQ